jgi:hypothetical protein
MKDSKAALAAGIAGGYVLGRTKKAKLALAVASYVVGRRIPLNPRQLADEGMRRIRENPHVAELGGQLRGELLQAGRTAASAAVNRRIESMADTLHARTEALSSGHEEGEEEEEEQEPEQERPSARDEEKGEDEPKGERGHQKKTTERRPARSAKGTRETEAKKKAGRPTTRTADRR